MEILSKKVLDKDLIMKEILSGKIFVYPTDTVYGIGCNALDSIAVSKVRKAKGSKKKFSVIAPSKEWVRENCEISERWLKKLPGPYTFVLKMRRQSVARNVSTKTLGVRIPRNWFSKFVSEAKVPFVTTSVNKSGKPNLVNPRKVPDSISKYVDYVIYDVVKDGKPSKVIDLSSGKKKIIRS
tara:strand:- start:1533 stop:2078 length:546 start_codon:yes stop_codon:yes gene_type:complete